MSSTVETTTEIRPFRFEVSDDELEGHCIAQGSRAGLSRASTENTR